MPTNVATWQGLPLAERARDALPGPLLGFAIASGAPIGWIAQHVPNRGSFPTAVARPCPNSALIQQARNGVDTESLLGIELKHHPHHLGLGLDHLVECCRGVTLPHISIAIGCAGEHVHPALLRHVLLASPAPLADLGALVFGNHALNLYQQLILRRGPR